SVSCCPMSDIDITSGVADRSRDLRLQGQILPPPGTTLGFVLTAATVNGALGSNWQAGGGGGSAVDVQAVADGAGQTWTKPGGAPSSVEVIVIGAGGGGGGGAGVTAPASGSSGGCGGGGGAVQRGYFLASDLGATVTVNVGAGGTGGAGG